MQKSPLHSAPEPESMDQLRGDCARMAPHWTAASRTAPVTPVTPSGAPSVPSHAPASYEALHGVRVPPGSARLVEGMADYGD